MTGRRLGWDEPAPADLFEHLAPETVEELRARISALVDRWEETRGGVVLAQCIVELRAALRKRGADDA